MLTTLLFALDIKFVLIESNALLLCASPFVRALQHNRAQTRLLFLLFIAKKKTYSLMIYLYFSLSLWKVDM